MTEVKRIDETQVFEAEIIDITEDLYKQTVHYMADIYGQKVPGKYVFEKEKDFPVGEDGNFFPPGRKCTKLLDKYGHFPLRVGDKIEVRYLKNGKMIIVHYVKE